MYRPDLHALLLKATLGRDAQASLPDAAEINPEGTNPLKRISAANPCANAAPPHIEASSIALTTPPPPRFVVSRQEPENATDATPAALPQPDREFADDGRDEMTALYVRPEEAPHPPTVVLTDVGTTEANDVTRLYRPRVPTRDNGSMRSTVPPHRRRLRGGALQVFSGMIIALSASAWIYREPLQNRLAPLAASFSQRWASARLSLGSTGPVSSRAPITLSISVSPATAKITLDGAPVPNPVVLRRSSDGQEHILSAEAPGYVPLRRAFRFERDIIGAFSLAPLETACPTSATGQEDAEVPAGDG